MAAPVIETTSLDDSGGATQNDLTINKPTGTVEDDLIQVVGGDDESNTFGYDTISGFTKDFDEGNGTRDCQLTFQHKVAGAAEPSTYTLSRPAGALNDEIWAWTDLHRWTW